MGIGKGIGVKASHGGVIGLLVRSPKYMKVQKMHQNTQKWLLYYERAKKFRFVLSD